MELLFAVIAVLVLWILFKIKNQIDTAQSTAPPSPNAQSNRINRIVDTGEIKELGEDTFCINIKSPFPITLMHTSRHNANQIKRLLNGESTHWEKNIDAITDLIAQNNIVCLELEEYLKEAKSEVFDFIVNQKLKSPDWKNASDSDKEELMPLFQAEAVQSLSCKPANKRALAVLLYNEPGGMTANKELLNLFSHNTELYNFYLSHIGRPPKIIRTTEYDYSRKIWESLTEMGLAIRGQNIPIETILRGLKLQDINHYFSNRLEQKHTQKGQAVEWAAAQPDALEVLSHHIVFNDFFLISKPADIDITEIRQCYKYAYAQAEIIKDTYVTGFNTIATLEDGKIAGYKAWELESEDCCQQCSKLKNRVTKPKSSNLPPFHIGCTCALQGVYD